MVAMKEPVKKKKQERKPRRAKRAVAAIGLVAWTAVALYGAAFLVGGILGLLRLGGAPIDEMNETLLTLIIQAAVYVLAVVLVIFVPWLVFRKKLKTTRDEMGLRGWPTWMDILLAIVGFVVSALAGIALVAIGAALLPNINWSEEQDVGFANLYLTKDLIMAFVALVVIAPVCEELIFRGWLYGKLRARIKVAPAVILVSLLFALVHGQVNVGVVVFAMSVANCLLRELTGTIYSGLFVHVIRNAIAFGAQFVLFV